MLLPDSWCTSDGKAHISFLHCPPQKIVPQKKEEEKKYTNSNIIFLKFEYAYLYHIRGIFEIRILFYQPYVVCT